MAKSFQRQVSFAYWLAWVPLCAMVVVLLYLDNGRLSLWQATTAGFVLSFLFAIVCRSTSYMCKSLSLSRTRIPRLVLVFVPASLVAAGLWVLISYGLGELAPRWWNSGLASKVDLLFGLGVALYLFAVTFHYTVIAVLQARLAESAAEQSRTLARESELRALRAQVDPHFLFNSLNSIAALSLADPSSSRRMSLQLAGFLRSTQQLGATDEITLEQELKLAKQYLAIQEQRFAQRMTVALNVPEKCLEILLPPLLLQPLLENAVKHGVETLQDNAWIKLDARCDGQMLYISLSNRYDPLAPRKKGTGRGTALVFERLNAHFGPAASVHHAHDDDTWSVELKLPAREVYTRS